MGDTCRIAAFVSLLALGGCGFLQDWGQFDVGDAGDTDVDAGACGPGNCSGCCQDGACVSGMLSAACGAGGASCAICTGAEMCAGGACVPIGATCPDVAGCPTGCCDGTTCNSGNTSSACGSGGDPCAACASGEACNAGTCVLSGCSVRDTGSGIEDTCTGEDICNCGGSVFCEGTGACVSAFGRIYSIGIGSVHLPPEPPGGGCWDGACGAPDPYVIVTVDAMVVGETPNGDDVRDFTWDPIQIFDARILAGSDVLLEVWDADAFADDFAFRCRHFPVSAAQLRSRDIGCGDATENLRAVVVFVP